MSESIHPKLSVIIPVYNVEEFLHECLDSVLNQTFKNYEIILVNDGSTDSSGKICDRYQLEHKKITAYHQSNNGLSNARNQGLIKAVGEYIIFLDSDDYWDNDYFLEKAFQSNPSSDLILFGIKKFSHESKVYIPYSKTNKKYSNCSDKNLKKLLRNKIYLSSACNKIINKEFINNNKLFFKEGVKSEDIVFSGKILHKGFSCIYLGQNFYVYRQRELSITKTPSKSSLVDLTNNIRELINNYPVQSAIFKRTYRSYVGFQLGVLAINIAITKSQNNTEALNLLIEFKHLMWFSVDVRLNIFYVVTLLIGTKNSLRLLRMIV